jgi:hypothetical protein
LSFLCPGRPVAGAVTEVLRACLITRGPGSCGCAGCTVAARDAGGGDQTGSGIWAAGRGPVLMALLREAGVLQRPGNLLQRSRACQSTFRGACRWHSQRDFLMVCERPLRLQTSWRAPAAARPHPLHRMTGPALAWPDG